MFTNILQPTHLLIVLIVALVLLGPRRLPDAGRALGQGLKEFRNSISGEHPEDQIPSVPPPAAHSDDSPGALLRSPDVAAPTTEPSAASAAPPARREEVSDSGW